MSLLASLAMVGALVWAPVPLPDADVDAPVRAIPVHDKYTPWRQPHRPDNVSCCDHQDCEPVEARYDEEKGVYFANIPGRGWTEVPKHIILDPKKPENESPDGGYHLCWNRTTGELLCFREAEPKS